VENRFRGVYCKFCRQPYIEHARHVDTDGCVKDCVPEDNLLYLELMLERKEKIDEASRTGRE
jgi:hypothetical protein